MVPAIATIPPNKFKAMLEKDGFQIVLDTELTWTFFKQDAPHPVIVLSKKGDLVSLSAMMEILDLIKMDNKKYFSLLKQVSD